MSKKEKVVDTDYIQTNWTAPICNHFDAEVDGIQLLFAAGTTFDGIPFEAEYWEQDGFKNVTFVFPVIDYFEDPEVKDENKCIYLDEYWDRKYWEENKGAEIYKNYEDEEDDSEDFEDYYEDEEDESEEPSEYYDESEEPQECYDESEDRSKYSEKPADHESSDDSDCAILGFKNQIEVHSITALKVGMAVCDEQPSEECVRTYVDYLIETGLVTFTTNFYNGYADYCYDREGNKVIAVGICLEEDYASCAECTLNFRPFPGCGYTRPTKLRRVK